MTPERFSVRICMALGLCFALFAASCATPDRASKSGELDDSSSPSAPVLQPQPQSGAALPALPKPSELPRRASTIPPDAGRIKDGMQFDIGFNNRIALAPGSPPPYSWPGPGDARYSPDYIGQQSTVTDIAYALYDFYGFINESGPQEVHVDWIDPQAYEDCWVGLANMSSDRWDWFALPQSETFSVGDIATYLADPDTLGHVAVAVVMLGTAPTDLEHLALGGPADILSYLLADLDSNETANIAPRTVNFSLVAQCAGCEFASVDFDLDGQAGYEILADISGLAQFEYTVPGVYTARARIHDDRGRSFDCEKSFTIIDPANQPPLAAVVSTQASGAAPLDVVLDASASSDPDGEILRYRWDVDADGEWDFDTGNSPFLPYTLGVYGQRFFVVEVRDNNFAVDTASNFVDMQSGWSMSVIDSGYVQDCSTGIIGTGAAARICCAYQVLDGNLTSLYFCKASNPEGSSWGSPALLTNQIGPGWTGNSPQILTRADGSVLVFYTTQDSETGDYSLYCQRSADTSGQSWNAPVLIRGDNVGPKVAAAMINGFPAVATVRNGEAPDNPLIYLASDTTTGSSWPSEHEVGSGGSGIIFPVSMIQGNIGPVIAVARNEFPSGQQTLFARASDMSGASWNEIRTIEDTYLGSGDLMALSNGKLCFGGSFDADQSPVLTFLCDQSDFSWTQAASLCPGPWPLGGELSATLSNGLPSVSFRSWNNNDLMYAQAYTSDGTSWQAPYEVYTIGSVGSACSMSSVNAKTVICFSDDSGDRLLAAWYKY